MPTTFAETAAGMEWGECWLEPGPMPPELTAEVRRAMGGVVPVWGPRLAQVPWLVRAFAHLNEKAVAHMSLKLFDLVAFVVSRDNACRYCYGNMHAILRILGYSDDYIDRLAHDVHLGELTAAEQTALEFARTVSHANPRVGAAELAALERAGYGRPAIAEIAYVAAMAVFSNRVATLLALPPERLLAAMAHPLARLLRPLIGRGMRGRPRAPEPLPHNDGPCADVVAALDGSPAAAILRGVIDDAIASPVLPRRTKLLMLAVIGRALGCDRSVDEARRGLAEDGLAPSDVEEIIANLGSPTLDGRDALLVPYARETVRYQNAVIQQRTRALCERLPVPEVLEAVGVAALANAVARLSILLARC